MEWLDNPNALWVLLGSVLLGISSGVLGSFALLRRRGLMGDALAHAALPGIGIAFIIAGGREVPVLLLGALLAGLAGAYAVQSIVRHSRIKEDTALGLVLSVFFAFGIVLLTQIQHSGAGSQAGLDKYLFGQAASLIGDDVWTMAVSAALVCLAAILLFKEFKLFCFDAEFAKGQGFSPRLLDGFLMVLIVLTVVIGMQAVGVVLMAAMLITPAAAARLWTDRLNVMVWLAGATGAVSGILGTWMSTLGFKMPTGPLIVISASIIFGISLVFAPRKGILAGIIRFIRLRSKVARENSLRSIYEIAESGGRWDVAFTVERLAGHRSTSTAKTAAGLNSLRSAGLVEKQGEEYRLTEVGLEVAYKVVRKHRLWEMFLMHESQIAADHVDRDADDIEHHLSPAIVKQLEKLLELHKLEMKIPPSVHPLGA